MDRCPFAPVGEHGRLDCTGEWGLAQHHPNHSAVSAGPWLSPGGQGTPGGRITMRWGWSGEGERHSPEEKRVLLSQNPGGLEKVVDFGDLLLSLRQGGLGGL